MPGSGILDVKDLFCLFGKNELLKGLFDFIMGMVKVVQKDTWL